MQNKKIMVLFTTMLPICALLRYFQFKFIIDSSNGFFKPENEAFGIASTIILFVAALCVGLFSYLTPRSPEKTPRPNTCLSIFSLLAAVAVFTDTFFAKVSVNLSPFLSILKIISALLCIFFFLSFSAKKFLNTPISSVAYLLPGFFMLIKIICEFSVISSVAVITDNIFLLAAYCAVLVFFLQFAKLYNNTDTELNFKKLLSSALVSVLLTVSQSVAYLAYNLPTAFKYAHTPFASNLFLLGIGLFIAVFTFFHFSERIFVRKH